MARSLLFATVAISTSALPRRSLLESLAEITGASQLEMAQAAAQSTSDQPRRVSYPADSLKRRRVAAFVQYSAEGEDKFAAAGDAPAAALAMLPERSDDAILNLAMGCLEFVLGHRSGRWL